MTLRQLRSGRIIFSLSILVSVSGCDSAQKTNTATSKPAKTSVPSSKSTVKLTTLPGRGLNQHPFLYCGRGDASKPEQTVFLIKNGKVAWQYSIPTRDAHDQTNEFCDIHMLSNGNILYAFRNGAAEVTPSKSIVWKYDCPPGTACHSAQPIGPDRVLIAQNGYPPKVLLINKDTNEVEMDHRLPIKDPKEKVQFWHVRMTRAGSYLVPRVDLGKVVEYDKGWNEIWSIDMKSCWAAVRLKNGNTLLSNSRNSFVREVSPDKKTVWEIKKDDLEGIPLQRVEEANRLANGNTVICNNWNGKGDSADNIQVIELTPDKKVVWALREWTDLKLGPASCIQLLDEVGSDEKFELQR